MPHKKTIAEDDKKNNRPCSPKQIDGDFAKGRHFIEEKTGSATTINLDGKGQTIS